MRLSRGADGRAAAVGPEREGSGEGQMFGAL